MLLELRKVAPAELAPLRPVSMEPLPETVRGSNRLRPIVQLRICLGQTAWPQPVDQDPIAIARRWCFVYALQFDSDGLHTSAWRPANDSRIRRG